MAKKQSRSNKASRYEPTPTEREKYSQLLTKLTPSRSAYRKYRGQVDNYLDMISPSLRGPQEGVMKSIRLRRSELFGGLEYLVAYVDDAWLGGVAPDCDAIASVTAERQEENTPWAMIPPFVLLPESKRRARNDTFRSVVEHEIVHINQAILGTFPQTPVERHADDLLALLLDRTNAEYEASFLQLVRWPMLFPEHLDVSMEHWCLVRGYSQSLRHVLVAAANLEFQPCEVEGFLELLSSSLLDRLQLIGATEELASWFPPRLDIHLAMAMKEVMAPFPEIKDHPAFRAAGLWLRPRLGIAGSDRSDTPIDK